jgi:intracellular septation protein
VNFKLFGGMGLLLLFTLAQGLYLGRYMEEPAAEGAPDQASSGNRT